jgi:hypothetical protein
LSIDSARTSAATHVASLPLFGDVGADRLSLLEITSIAASAASEGAGGSIGFISPGTVGIV